MSKDLDNIFSLNNRVIIITGAVGLLGRMHAEAIAAFGGIPVLIDLKLHELNEFETARGSGGFGSTGIKW